MHFSSLFTEVWEWGKKEREKDAEQRFGSGSLFFLSPLEAHVPQMQGPGPSPGSSSAEPP